MHLRHVTDWWLIVCLISNSLCQCLNIYGPDCIINYSKVWGIFKTNDNTIVKLFLVRWLKFTYPSVMPEYWPCEFPPVTLSWQWIHYDQWEQSDRAELVMARFLLLEGELLTWKSILKLRVRFRREREWKQWALNHFNLLTCSIFTGMSWKALINQLD